MQKFVEEFSSLYDLGKQLLTKLEKIDNEKNMLVELINQGSDKQTGKEYFIILQTEEQDLIKQMIDQIEKSRYLFSITTFREDQKQVAILLLENIRHRQLVIDQVREKNKQIISLLTVEKTSSTADSKFLHTISIQEQNTLCLECIIPQRDNLSDLSFDLLPEIILSTDVLHTNSKLIDMIIKGNI